MLTLGILSLLVCGPILGPIAWVMGTNDLKAMAAGRMDRDGEGITRAGQIIGMVATLVAIHSTATAGSNEEKVDGWRIVALKDGARVRLVSRTGRDHAGRFPEIAEPDSDLIAHTFVLPQAALAEVSLPI